MQTVRSFGSTAGGGDGPSGGGPVSMFDASDSDGDYTAGLGTKSAGEGHPLAMDKVEVKKLMLPYLDQLEYGTWGHCDSATVCCCLPCSLTQQAREVYARTRKPPRVRIAPDFVPPVPPLKTLPEAVPAVDDMLAPCKALVEKASVPDFELLKGDAIEWFNGLDDPVETIAPPFAALGAAAAVSSVAHFPLVSLVAPRALELVGAGVCAVAARRYGNAEGSLKEDLAKRAVEAGDAVRKIMVK